jgi:hypothetical protein
MTRRRYTAESGRVRSTLGRKDYSLADAEEHCRDLERIKARDEARGDHVNARQLELLIADLSAAVRDARAQQQARAA